ncbi:Co-chaperone Hsc20 [Xylaria arbuscula]|nr:Co-chaperone Hsc20 [Xylaria arbuscula]
MRSSRLPARQIRRVCDFCRQQQQHNITTTRSIHASPTRKSRAIDPPPLASLQYPSCGPRHDSRISTRLFSRSSILRNNNDTSNENTTTATTQQPSDDAKSNADKAKTPPQTHYDFFPETLPAGPPPHGPFEIDVRALRREFLALQGGAHPDLHPAHMKARAQATSARINEAFRTLARALPRAQYVLALRGLDVAGDETAKVEDPALLLLVLEAREGIEEAQSEEELEGLKAENEERIRASEERLGELFAGDLLEEAREEAVRLRYWVNVRESIDNWERGKPIVLEH